MEYGGSENDPSGGWGGDEGSEIHANEIADAMRAVMRGRAAPPGWGGPQGPQNFNFNREAIYGFSPNSQYGSPASPHSGMSPMGNMGNIEGVPAGAYGPGPLDPMSTWSGPGWSPGVGQPAPGKGPYGGPITGTGYPGATENYFGNPAFAPGIDFGYSNQGGM